MKGGAIKRNRFTDNLVRAAQLRQPDRAFFDAELGAELDSGAPMRLVARMWVAYAKWAVCTGVRAAAYALELGARTRAETKRRTTSYSRSIVWFAMLPQGFRIIVEIQCACSLREMDCGVEQLRKWRCRHPCCRPRNAWSCS